MWMRCIVISATFIISCNESSVLKSTDSTTLLLSIKDTEMLSQNDMQTGRYGELSIALDTNSRITGVYEFYENWDERYKEYLQVNTFYFTGNLIKRKAKIKTAWPLSDQTIEGEIEFFNDSLRLRLYEIPDGYASLDFKKGFTRKIEQKRKWTQIRLVKSPKAYLFNSPDAKDMRRSYLVSEDVVRVVSIVREEWYEVDYSIPGEKVKYIRGWIRAEDLYDVNPEKWKSR